MDETAADGFGGNEHLFCRRLLFRSVENCAVVDIQASEDATSANVNITLSVIVVGEVA